MCAFFLHAARRNERRARKVTAFDTESNTIDQLQTQFENTFSSTVDTIDTNQNCSVTSNLKSAVKKKKKYATRGQTTSNTINQPEKSVANLSSTNVSSSQKRSQKVTIVAATKPANKNATNKKELEEWINTAPKLRATRYSKAIGVLSMTESLEDESTRVKGMTEEERARIFRVGNRLVDACKAGNVKKAKQIIDACKTELLLQWSVCKAFLAACEGSHVNIARLLMANGLNPKVQPGVAHALHVSVTHNAKLEAVEFLVKAGFDVNQPRRPQMYTPLHIACMTNNAVIIEALVKLGADVNAVANDGSDSMPLNLCRKMGNNSKCIEILKKAGAKSTWRKQKLSAATQSAKKYVTAGGMAGGHAVN